MQAKAARNTAARQGLRPEASSHARLQGQRQQAQRLGTRMFILSLALLIALIAIFIGVMTRVADRSEDIESLNARIAAEKNHRLNLELTLSKREDIELIRSTAIEMGMTKPGSWSIRVMSLSGDMNSAGQAVYTVAAQQEGQ